MSDKVVSAKEIYAQPEPTDRMAWALCPYLRKYEDCLRCPQWESDAHYGDFKRGCRMQAEEACRAVLAAKEKGTA